MKINGIAVTSILLSFVAGYADTSTFVGADRLFSAHVTGNFVVFAYDIVTHQVSQSWIKLISFPVFILAVIFSTLLVDVSNMSGKGADRLLIMEGFLLITAGGMAHFYQHEDVTSVHKVISSMLVVFALGLQNAYGRFSAKEVLGPTTVMTGNVTQLFIDITNYLRPGGQRKQESALRIVNWFYVILPFLMGCICGGMITRSIGLGSTFFIGILVLVASRNKNRSVANERIVP